jgi:hypothetical protein
MHLGSNVISKHTGLPAYGTVVGFMTAPFYCHSKNVGPNDFQRWNDLYPDWFLKPVVIVEFNEPQKALTFEEYKLGFPPEMEVTEEEMKTLYKFVQKQLLAAYPIDDLDVLDEVEVATND